MEEQYTNNMIHNNIYIKSGELLATGYNRVVHGERGDYVEFEKEHIVLDIISKYGNDISNTNVDYYYYWLCPKCNKDVKVYYQLKTVKYADYKIGKYYISPSELFEFIDTEKLF